MKAVVVSGQGQLGVEDVPDPVPRPDEVVLQVAAAGICGTDVQIADGEYAPTLPIVPGHEFAGTVVELGSEVGHLRLGQRVAADPNIPCGRCRYCRLGRVNLCEHYDAIGVTRPGAAAQLVAVPAKLCVVLPERLSEVDAALAEPLSCVLHGVDLVGSPMGLRWAVIGAGAIGMMAMQLAAHGGAASVDIVDTNPDRQLLGRRLGLGQVASTLAELDDGGGWDVVVDATGVGPAIEDGLGRVACGGTFLQLGVARTTTTVLVHPYRVYEEEIRILGSVCPLNSFDRAMQALASGAVQVAGPIGGFVPLEGYAEALARFAAGATRKVVVTP